MLLIGSKSIRPRFFLAAAATISMLSMTTSVLPASAATSAVTTLTFTIQGGPLAITAPAGAIDSGIFDAATSAVALKLTVGKVTCSDTRGAPNSGWVVSASVSAFADAKAQKISITKMVYSIGSFTKATPNGTVSTSGGLTPISSAGVAVVEAKATDGGATASWTSGIEGTIAVGAAPGFYTGVLTHSIL